MKVLVTGNIGYGVTYGCCDVFSRFCEYECSIEQLGKLLYNILTHPPFEDFNIKIL